MTVEKKNILIVGSGAVASALAKKLSKYDEVGKIFIAPDNVVSSELYEKVDIREEDLTGLLKFVIENDVYLTIPISDKALNSDIVSFFQSNGQSIFGSAARACDIALNAALGKKFLYKIHAQTSKFGIFDKQSQAESFLREANFPVTIKSSGIRNFMSGRLVCPTVSLALEYLSTLFSKNETDVLIEEFVYGGNFCVYFISDGYSALPIGAVCEYNFAQDGDGGILTTGVGSYAPDYKISDVTISRVLNIVNNTLNNLEKKGEPYVGILGVECILTGEDKFFVSEFKPFLQNHDAGVVLNLIDDNLFDVFVSCVNGSFSDVYEQIKTNNLSSVGVVVLSRSENKEISGLDNFDDFDNIDFINVKENDGKYFTQKGAAFVINSTSSTLARARNRLYEDLGEINFDTMKYRKDICQPPKGEC